MQKKERRNYGTRGGKLALNSLTGTLPTRARAFTCGSMCDMRVCVRRRSRCRRGPGRQKKNIATQEAAGTRPRVANLTGKYLDCRIHGIDTSSGAHPAPSGRIGEKVKGSGKSESASPRDDRVFTRAFRSSAIENRAEEFRY